MYSVLGIILFAISSYNLGHYITKLVRYNGLGRLEIAVIEIGLGIAVWGNLLFVAGHIGLLHNWLIVVLGILLSIPIFTKIDKMKTVFVKARNMNLSRSDIVFIFSIFIILSVTFIACFAPVVGGVGNDEIATHLSVPKLWLKNHSFEILSFPVSYLAGHGSLFFLWLMSFSEEAGPKLFSWLCMVIAGLSVYGFTKKTIGKRAALVSAIFVFVNPIIFRSSYIAFVGLPSALFSFLSFRMLLCFYESRKTVDLIISAVFLGVSCSIKPTGYFYIPVMLVILAVIIFKSFEDKIKTLFKFVTIFMTIVLLTGFGWATRNFVLSGSPTFPPPAFLLNFDEEREFEFSEKIFRKEDFKEQYDYYESRVEKYGRGFKNFMLLPWNLTMTPEAFSIGDSIGTLLLSTLPLVFFFGRKPFWLILILLHAFWGSASVYFLINPEGRYFLPIFLSTAPLVGWVVEKLREKKNTATLIILVLSFNVIFSIMVLFRISYEPLQAVFIKEKRSEYILKNTPFSKAYQFIEKNNVALVNVFYDDQSFYHLKNDYVINENILNELGKKRGEYILDIDYSKRIEKGRSTGIEDFIIKNPMGKLDLVYKCDDARIYKVN